MKSIIKLKLKLLEFKLFVTNIKIIVEHAANNRANNRYIGNYWTTNYSDKAEKIRRKRHKLQKMYKLSGK